MTRLGFSASTTLHGTAFLTFYLVLLLLCLRPAAAQAISSDAVDFTSISVWNDLRVCLQSCFQTDYAYSHSGIAGVVGCSTNAGSDLPLPTVKVVFCLSSLVRCSCQIKFSALMPLSHFLTVLQCFHTEEIPKKNAAAVGGKGVAHRVRGSFVLG
jgi:hypothetical protein